jgi:phosphate transport system permease protein
MTTVSPSFDNSSQGQNFTPHLDKRNRNGRIFQTICMIGTVVGIFLLALLMLRVLADGLPRLDWNALSNVPSQVNPQEAGFRIAILGTFWVVTFTLLLSVPLGVGSAIYLEEYAPKNRFTNLLELNIANLAGVPSVIYGVLGLGLFVRLLGLGPVVLAGAMTMALVILPVIIVAAREAIRSVPLSMREASYGVGATKWQTISNHVLPYALPGILTGVIIGVSRAIGDSASLLIIGGLVFITTNPNLFSRFIVLPLQIYFNISQPQAEYKQLAAAGIIILLIALLILNASAIYIRNRFEQRY